MRKEKKELLRLQTMIENDRVNTGNNFLQLIESDINKLLRDYFDFTIPPEIKIETQNNAYYFTLNLKVSRIKSFASVSRETIDNF